MKKLVNIALSTALAQNKNKPERKVAQRRESLFSSPMRRSIFEFLCRHPCCGASRIAIETRISIPTAQWHLRKMAVSGYLLKKNDGKTVLFYPDRLFSNKLLEPLMYFSKPKRILVFRDLILSPGKTSFEIARDIGLQKNIVKSTISGLIKMDLAVEIKDGRTNRYFPTNKFDALCVDNRRNWKGFRDWLLESLSDEMLSPTVIRASPETLVIGLSVGKEKIELSLKTDIWNTILEG